MDSDEELGMNNERKECSSYEKVDTLLDSADKELCVKNEESDMEQFDNSDINRDYMLPTSSDNSGDEGDVRKFDFSNHNQHIKI